MKTLLYLVIIAVLVGIVLPALFSAKSTFAVLVGCLICLIGTAALTAKLHIFIRTIYGNNNAD